MKKKNEEPSPVGQVWENYPKNWRTIDTNTLNFILSQSEDLLKATIESNDTVTDRSDKLMGIYLTLTGALMAYLITNLEKLLSFNILSIEILPISACLSLVCVFIGLTYCYRNTKKYTVAVLGEYPQNSLRTEYIDAELSDAEKYIAIVIAAIRNLKSRIEENELTSLKRSANNQRAINWLLPIPLTPMIAIILFRLIPYLLGYL